MPRSLAIITVFDVATAGGGRSIRPADPVSLLSPLLLFLILKSAKIVS